MSWESSFCLLNEYFAGATTHLAHVLNQCQRVHLFDDGVTLIHSQCIRYVISFFLQDNLDEFGLNFQEFNGVKS